MWGEDMKNNLSDSERHLWKYIEENISKISDYSIIKVSQEANVSTATIVRAMKKRGYEGFTSFKHSLKEDKRNTLNFANLEKIDSEIQRAIIKNEREVTGTINNIDSGVIEDAVQKIHSANRIIIFARGLSELSAQEMVTKLQLSGKNCQLQTDPNIIINLSQTLRRWDLVIFISLNGETTELIKAARICYNQEISTILITTNRDSTLAKYSEIVFVGYKTLDPYFPEYEVQSRLSLAIIIRILLDSYVIRTKEH